MQSIEDEVTYQFVEDGVVIISDHICLLFGPLLRVRSQTRDHVGIRVGAVGMLLFVFERKSFT